MRVDKTVEHILAECPAYEVDRDKVIREYKGIMGEDKFREVGWLEDMGIAEDVPMQVIEITKTFLCQVWWKRE